jgi:hypothetical protein
LPVADDRPFTDCREPELEERIAADLGRIRTAVEASLGPSLVALLLGGGFGRGEGGGIRDAGGRLAPYNDYDLVAVVRGVPRWKLGRLRKDLTALATGLESALGIEVELSPLRSEDLRRLPFTMMWCELFAAHRLIAGDGAVLGLVPAMPPAELPLIEGTRYLTNRAALLLWARVDDLPPGRVWKFVHKAWLAAGAGALIGRRAFVVGYGARQAKLEQLASAEGALVVPGLPMALLVERHREAASARLVATDPPGDAELARRVEEVRAAILGVWRWLEERRTARPFADWAAYASAPGLFREPLRATPSTLARQLLLMRERAFVPPFCLREHPRTRVSRALPGLLAGNLPDEATRRLVGGGDGWADAAARCLALWRRAN